MRHQNRSGDHTDDGDVLRLLSSARSLVSRDRQAPPPPAHSLVTQWTVCCAQPCTIIVSNSYRDLHATTFSFHRPPHIALTAIWNRRWLEVMATDQPIASVIPAGVKEAYDHLSLPRRSGETFARELPHMQMMRVVYK